jgi:hypothetical protein
LLSLKNVFEAWHLRHSHVACILCVLHEMRQVSNGQVTHIFPSACFVSRPPLWSSCQSSWLQIQRSGVNSRRYLIFWEVVGLERGPLSLVSTIEELLGRKIAAPVYKFGKTAMGISNAAYVAPYINKGWR